MKRKAIVTLTAMTLVIASMCMSAFATSSSGTIKYKEHSAYVYGYIDYVNAPPLIKDKVWASASLYGTDAWYIASDGDGAYVHCYANEEGEDVFEKTLIYTDSSISVDSYAVSRSNSYATLYIKIKADSGNTLTLVGTD